MDLSWHLAQLKFYQIKVSSGRDCTGPFEGRKPHWLESQIFVIAGECEIGTEHFGACSTLIAKQAS